MLMVSITVLLTLGNLLFYADVVFRYITIKQRLWQVVNIALAVPIWQIVFFRLLYFYAAITPHKIADWGTRD
jgi:hypothetical protein